MNPLKYINKMIEMYEGPRITAQEPRTLVADASTEMEQSPDSFLRPKRYDILTGLDVPAETLEDFDVNFRKPNAQGGRIGLQGGQLVQPGVGRQGYQGEKPVAGSFDEFADAVLNSYAKDDITFIKDYKYSNNITRAKENTRGYLDKLVEKTGLDEDTVLNLFDDREAYIDMEVRTKPGVGASPRAGDFYKKAENWIIKNSSRYADPDKFKKAFIRTFGTNNDLIKTLKRLNVGEKRKRTSVPFSNWFKETILGTTEGVKAGYNLSLIHI